MNKNITDIKYSWNNLPNHILLAQDHQNTIDYLYDAAGTKLQKFTSSDRAAGLPTDYSGPFVYEDSKLAFIQTSEGRIVPDHDTYAYEYFLKDHLGNTRVVFNEQGEVLQNNSYYPFGGIMEGLNYTADLRPENKYLYNGKEMQDDFGLDWYDYGFRFYDPALARWHVQDPLAEKYYSLTPYHYVNNNPVAFLDLFGLDWFFYAANDDDEASWHWHDSEEYVHEYSYTNEEGETVDESITLQGVEAVVVFDGSPNESLGTKEDHVPGANNKSNQYIDGEEANTAEVTVYGPDGEDDVETYTGFTMSSDPNEFGVVTSTYDEFFNVTRNENEQGIGNGPYDSPWIVEGGGRVNDWRGYNPAHPERSDGGAIGYLTGVYVHRTNNDGWAGTWTRSGVLHGVSEGCFLIESGVRSRNWNRFNNQLNEVDSFTLQIIRR